jgi:signal transduction histidine kinase
VADGLFARLRERSGTIRVRTTAAAVIVVGATLLVAAVAMVVLLRRSLTDDLRDAALLRAESVAEGLSEGPPDDPIPVGDQEEEFVQVLDSDGNVVASSANLQGRDAVARLAPGESRKLEEGLGFEDDPFLAVAASAEGGFTVVAGTTFETVTESTQAVVPILVAGVPLLLLVLGIIMWRVVGRTLAPVEAMRAEVEAISSKELHRRVPDPPSRDEVARLAATMNQMLARREAGQKRQRRFVSDASHELRSPVATIRQHAEVALSHPDRTRVEELAEVVLQEDARLQQLVEDLLLLTKIDEGTLSLRTESVDLDDILFEEAERVSGSTDVHVDAGRVSAGRVTGDRGQLGRLVRNLVDNAARHAHGNVALSLRAADGEVVLTVDDDGDGIPAAERRRVFERFVRLEEARDRDSGGSGLGLAIVAEIAGAHGATVEVREGPLGGARLEVRFPAQGAADLQDRSATPQVDGAP